MRPFLLALLLFVACAPVLAGPFQREPNFSAAGLKAFSQETGLGGSVETFRQAEREVAVVTRSFTSGPRSSDLHVFIRTKEDRFFEVLGRTAIWGSHLTVAQSGDTVRVSLDPEGRLLLEFTISGCYDDRDRR